MFFTPMPLEERRSFRILSFQGKNIADMNPAHPRQNIQSLRDTEFLHDDNDAFHLPFPPLAERHFLVPVEEAYQPKDELRFGHEVALMAQIDSFSPDRAVNQDSDAIFGMPPEISDLILSYLSPAALDAARYTCRLWRQRITGNRWLLSTVLDRHKQKLPVLRRASVITEADADKLTATDGLEPGYSHRDLLKRLDQESGMLSTHLDSVAWRTRFRMRHLDFSTSVSPNYVKSNSRFTAAARIGSQSGLMVFQVSSSEINSVDGTNTSTLIFYHFDSNEMPLYAGCVDILGLDGELDITDILESEPRNSRALIVRIGDHVRIFLVEPRDAFAKSDCQFSVRELSFGLLAQQPGYLNVQVDARTPYTASDVLPRSNTTPKVLTCFPNNGRISGPDSLSQGPEPRYLAEHVSSGDIIVVKGSQHPGNGPQRLGPSTVPDYGKQYLCGTAVLLRPSPDFFYRNVALAPAASRHGTIRVAIIWQSRSCDNSRSELYIYDVPDAIYYEPCHLHGFGPVTSSGEEFANHRTVQGKRVTSLDHRMGGIHLQSPLWDLAVTAAIKQTYQKLIALGGLQLPSATTNQHDYPQDVQYQKCFAWGPTSDNDDTSIHCNIFDFSYADPQHGGPNGHSPDMGSYITSRQVHCACALHDEGFRIVLPSIPGPIEQSREAGSTSSKSISSSFWPWKLRAGPKADSNVGSITRNDSLARQEALARRQEWFKERIRCMKRAGLSNVGIQDLWGQCRWTQYGQIRKPVGWKDLE